MTKTRIDAGEWVVVCDGTKASVLQNVGDEKFPNLRTQEVITQKDPPTHEQGTSSPGRVQHSVGTGAARGAADGPACADRARLSHAARCTARSRGGGGEDQIADHRGSAAGPRG